MKKVKMVNWGLEPGAARWEAQMNPLSNGGTPIRPFVNVENDFMCNNCVTFLIQNLYS